ncbi:MAG: HNH endonuclease [Thaumarchaeota archaeon]|nr:HNH endonuclease [Nitrososphaerota archaeon]MBI3640895.1 HNH endonuclease [Nitrososphaerota archaeon]
MSRMNGTTRKMLYSLLVRRDGEHCRHCHALASERELVIDHKDNDNNNNRLENLQLLCRKCNYLKNPRRPIDECVSVCVPLEQTSEIKINKIKEPMFRNYVASTVSKFNLVSEQDLIDSSAEALGISPVTTSRYLRKLCSSEGRFERIQVDNQLIVRYKKPLIEK